MPHWVSGVAFRNAGTHAHTIAGWLYQQKTQRRVVLIHWQKGRGRVCFIGLELTPGLSSQLMTTLALHLGSRVGKKGDYVNKMSHFVLLKTGLKNLIPKHQVQSRVTLMPHLYFYIMQSWVQALWEKGKSGQTQGKQTHKAICISNSVHTIEKPAQK